MVTLADLKKIVDHMYDDCLRNEIEPDLISFYEDYLLSKPVEEMCIEKCEYLGHQYLKILIQS